jgi:hypothetical protein
MAVDDIHVVLESCLSVFKVFKVLQALEGWKDRVD